MTRFIAGQAGPGFVEKQTGSNEEPVDVSGRGNNSTVPTSKSSKSVELRGFEPLTFSLRTAPK